MLDRLAVVADDGLWRPAVEPVRDFLDRHELAALGEIEQRVGNLAQPLQVAAAGGELHAQRIAKRPVLLRGAALRTSHVLLFTLRECRGMASRLGFHRRPNTTLHCIAHRPLSEAPRYH
jgi:hypothetical protein